MKATGHEKNLILCGKLHSDTNHTYDEMPYIYHLDMVVSMGEKFIHLIPEQDREVVLTACAGHDLIEDARLTYNDVKKLFGEKVAEIVYALTNEKGKDRAERANDKYYEGIRTTEYAPFVKLCDRLANVSHSKMKKSRMFGAYHEENVNFLKKVLPENHNLGEMATELENLFI